MAGIIKDECLVEMLVKFLERASCVGCEFLHWQNLLGLSTEQVTINAITPAMWLLSVYSVSSLFLAISACLSFATVGGVKSNWEPHAVS